jgi:hypothetical protein
VSEDWRRFDNVPWDVVTIVGLNDQKRAFLRSLPDEDIDQMSALVQSVSRDDPSPSNRDERQEEVARLNSLLAYRALTLAEDRVWASLTAKERAALMDELPHRGDPQTVQYAHGVIDAQVLVRAGAFPTGQRPWPLRLESPRAIAHAGADLAQPGAFATSFGLGRPREPIWQQVLRFVFSWFT